MVTAVSLPSSGKYGWTQAEQEAWGSQEQAVHAQTGEAFLGLHTKYQPLKQALAEAQAQQTALQAARRHALPAACCLLLDSACLQTM